MVIGMLIANGVCVAVGAFLLRTLLRPPADPTSVESFAAVLQAVRPTVRTRAAAARTWIPWTGKETRPC